jgi:hypothetical protein
MVYHPAKVYSFSPQIFPTGIEVDESVNSAGSGLKHGRTSSIFCAQLGCGAQINWSGIPFADTHYTAVCTTENGSTETLVSVGQKATTFVFANLPSGSLNKGIVVDCIAMHD